MIRSRRFIGFVGVLAAAGFVLALVGTPRALAPGKKDAHLR